jgi:hypothetical protein
VFTRVKKSRDNEYLQVVENYRDGDRIRQRLVLYVGHYESLERALEYMPKDVGYFRRRATESERWGYEWAEYDRRKAEELASKLEVLRRLVWEHPDLLERDRGRAERQRKRARATKEAKEAARQARCNHAGCDAEPFVVAGRWTPLCQAHYDEAGAEIEERRLKTYERVKKRAQEMGYIV